MNEQEIVIERKRTPSEESHRQYILMEIQRERNKQEILEAKIDQVQRKIRELEQDEETNDPLCHDPRCVSCIIL